MKYGTWLERRNQQASQKEQWDNCRQQMSVERGMKGKEKKGIRGGSWGTNLNLRHASRETNRDNLESERGDFLGDKTLPKGILGGSIKENRERQGGRERKI